MWTCYAFDNLSKEIAVTLKDAVSLQQREFSILELDATINMNRILSEGDLEYLSVRQQKYADGMKVCEEFLEDRIVIDTLVIRFKELGLLDIREDLYNMLPKHLQEVCDS